MKESLRAIVTDPDLIYVDHGQVGVTEEAGAGFKVCALRWAHEGKARSADYAWWTEGKLFAVEEKRATDLGNSLRNRRLQRELSGLAEEADVPMLALRLERVGWSRDAEVFSWLPETWGKGELGVELGRWLAFGALILLPSSPDRVLFVLKELKDSLRPCPRLFSILSGTDRKRLTGHTPFQRALKRLFTGLQWTVAGKLEVAFYGNVAAALSAPSQCWKDMGAHRGIIRQLEGYQKGGKDGC